jgi:glycosyltransferase involved in cell wall biosynthesis
VNKARIVIDARKISSSTGRYATGLIKNLEKLDTANEYIMLVMPDEADYYKPAAKNFRVVIADFKPYSFAEQLGLNRFLRDLNPDLVHFHMPQQPLLYNKPAITTVHDLNLLRITSNDDMNPVELRIKKLIFARLLRTVARRSKRIITPSQYTKDDLVEFAGIAPDKVTVTYEGALTATTKPEAVEEYERTPFILYVGRAEPYKNNRRLMTAHQHLLNKHPDLRLVIAGQKDILRQSDIKWASGKGYKQIDFRVL